MKLVRLIDNATIDLRTDINEVLRLPNHLYVYANTKLKVNRLNTIVA